MRDKLTPTQEREARQRAAGEAQEKADTEKAARQTEVTRLDGRADSLASTNDNQASLLQDHNSRLSTAESVNSNQATLLQGLRTDVNAVQGVNSNQATLLQGLRDDVNTALNVNANQADLIQDLRSDVTSIKSDIVTLKNQMANRYTKGQSDARYVRQ